jgi:hypothetical protein
MFGPPLPLRVLLPNHYAKPIPCSLREQIDWKKKRAKEYGKGKRKETTMSLVYRN